MHVDPELVLPGGYAQPRYTDSYRYSHGYKAACDTDIAKTFERIRRQQQKLSDAGAGQNVEPIRPRTQLRTA